MNFGTGKNLFTTVRVALPSKSEQKREKKKTWKMTKRKNETEKEERLITWTEKEEKTEKKEKK